MVVALAAFGLTGGAAWAAHHEGEEGHGKSHHAKKFAETDTDGNGEISLEEWMASAESRFARMDADANGSLTAEEMKAAHAKMRERWKEKNDDTSP
jgi:hypothetical protein